LTAVADLPTAPTTLSDRFLVAFARAEDALRQILGSNSKESFRWMLRHAAKRSPSVRSVEDDLLELSELRNAIVHERGGGYVIAEPHAETVERLERIVDLLLDPPRVDQVMSRPVATCAPEESVADAARRMVRGDYSRLPIYGDDGLVGLLTTNAIARWLGSRLPGSIDAALAEPVGAVMGFADAGRRYEIVARDRLVADVIALFATATSEGRRLEAVIVTGSGEANEHPVGIITVQDLPRLYLLVAP
jgi:CBS domain-containing protein